MVPPPSRDYRALPQEASPVLSVRASPSTYVSSRDRSRSQVRREGEGVRETPARPSPHPNNGAGGGRDPPHSNGGGRGDEGAGGGRDPPRDDEGGRGENAPQPNRGVNPQDFPIVNNLVRGFVDSYLREIPGIIPPVVAAPTFQSEVENESRATQDVLKRLYPMYKNKIKRVTHSETNKVSYVYDFDLPREEGFWSTPDPTLPYKGGKDPIGVFKNLEAPTLSRAWTLSSEPHFEEIEEGELPSPPEEKFYKGMDALARPVVPGRCKELELEEFLSGKPLSRHSTKNSQLGTCRYMEVDQDVFPLQRYVKCDNNTLIPSLEYKTRLIARDCFSALDMLKAKEAKTRALFDNWNSQGIWEPETGIKKDENGNLVIPADGSLVADTVSKEHLLRELHRRADLNNLAILQLDHQAKLLTAMHAEQKLHMREVVLYNAMPRSNNQVLVESMRNSRLSTPFVFGPIPESHRDRLRVFPHEGQFVPFTPPSSLVNFTAPVRSQSFRGRGGNRGRFPSHSQNARPRNPRGQFRRGRSGNFIRSSKNRPQGGKSLAPQAPQPTNRGASAGGKGRGKGRSRRGKPSRRARGK